MSTLTRMSSWAAEGIVLEGHGTRARDLCAGELETRVPLLAAKNRIGRAGSRRASAILRAQLPEMEACACDSSAGVCWHLFRAERERWWCTGNHKGRPGGRAIPASPRARAVICPRRILGFLPDGATIMGCYKTARQPPPSPHTSFLLQTPSRILLFTLAYKNGPPSPHPLRYPTHPPQELRPVP